MARCKCCGGECDDLLPTHQTFGECVASLKIRIGELAGFTERRLRDTVDDAATNALLREMARLFPFLDVKEDRCGS